MIEVEFLGWQERVDGSKILLVNEVISRSTVVYDPKKHVIKRRRK